MEDETVYLTPEDVADRWHVSHQIVNKMLRERILGGMKVGKFWRLRVEDVEEYENSFHVCARPKEAREQKRPASSTPVMRIV